MNIVTRFTPPEYCFVAHDPPRDYDKRVGGPFEKGVLEQFIPGSLNLLRRDGRSPNGRPRVVLNLARVVHDYETGNYRNIEPGRFIPCLTRFFSMLHEESNPNRIILRVMDHLAGKHLAYGQRTWGTAVGDFAFLTHLLGPHVLRGAQCLLDGLSMWLLDNCEIFATEAPLLISLQFVQLCKDGGVFETAMSRLMGSLSPQDLQVLLEKQGKIDLLFSRSPSSRIARFIRMVSSHQGFGAGPHGRPRRPIHPPYLHPPRRGTQAGRLMPNWWLNALDPHPNHPFMNGGGFGMGGPIYQYGMGF